jgi:hypothetical protein
MPALRRYVEWMSRGRRTDRVTYVLKELPMARPGAEWQIDPKFNAAEEILAASELKDVFAKAIAKGVAVPGAKISYNTAWPRSVKSTPLMSSAIGLAGILRSSCWPVFENQQATKTVHRLGWSLGLPRHRSFDGSDLRIPTKNRLH